MVAPEPFFEPRGTPFSVLHRIRALRSLGHTVELVTYPVGSDPDLKGVPIHRSARPPWVRDVDIGPSITKALLDVPLFLSAYRRFRRGTFDLVHTHEEAGYFGAWLSRRSGTAHLYDMHSSLPQQLGNFERFAWPPLVAAFGKLERYTLSGSDGVIAICPDLAERAREAGYEGPVAVIENTLDIEPPEIGPEDRERLRRELGVGDRRLVVYTGTFEPYQGLDLVVRAAERVCDRRSDVHFVLVGGTAAQIAELRSLARAVGADGHVTLRRRVPPEDVFLYHEIADVLITARTRGTNTPLKIYQYLRASRPVVATEIRAHTQVLDETCAELVPPTATGLAEGVLRVLASRERRRSLKSGAERLCRERYSEEAYLSRLRGIVQDARARRTGRLPDRS